MSGKSPAIFLGDLALAIHDLGIADPVAIQLIAEMLGLSVETYKEATKQTRAVAAQEVSDELRADQRRDKVNGTGSLTKSAPGSRARLMPSIRFFISMPYK
jgi:hypothetical protein